MPRPDLTALFSAIRGREADHGQLLEASARLFGADGASLFLARADGACRLAAAYGAASAIPRGAIVRPGKGIGGRAIESRAPLLVGGAEGPGKARRDVGSALVVPLYTAEGAVGLLNFSRRKRRRPYDQGDLDRAAQVGAVLSFLFANAGLLQQVEAQRARLHDVLDLLGLATYVFEPDGSTSTQSRATSKLAGPAPGWEETLAALPEPIALGARGAVDRLDKSRAAAESVAWGERSVVVSALRLGDGGLALAVEDVTEREQFRAELERARRLAEIGQMAAAIAHEIRNPLTSLAAAGRMLQRTPEVAVEFGKIVEGEARRLDRLCDDFLALARPIHLRLATVRLAELAQSVVSAHRPAAEAAGVALDLFADADVPTIEADAARIEAVLHNLVLNAIQACTPGDEVRVRVGASGFRVEDSGRGIDEAAMTRLFTPFFTTRSGGTGLGLCNVKRIVDAHGGRIEVRRLERGVAFDVRLARRAA